MHFVGWLRTGPSRWAEIGWHEDYQKCWNGLNNRLGTYDRRKRWFELIVLPKGEKPVSDKSNIPPDLAKNWTARPWGDADVEGLGPPR